MGRREAITPPAAAAPRHAVRSSLDVGGQGTNQDARMGSTANVGSRRRATGQVVPGRLAPGQVVPGQVVPGQVVQKQSQAALAVSKIVLGSQGYALGEGEATH